MRKFLGTLVILLILIGGVGFYRGWFDVSADDEPGVTNVELTIDKEKISEDAEAAKAKARELANRVEGDSDAPGTAASEADAAEQ